MRNIGRQAEANEEVGHGAYKTKEDIVQKRYHCVQCGKSFTRRSSLIVHQRVHTGEKLFQCTQCGKSFGLKSSMVRHMRIHITKTANQCPDCGRSFSRYSSLFQHQKVHRRGRSHRSFSRTSQVGVHRRTRRTETAELRAEDQRSPQVIHRAEESRVGPESAQRIRRHQRTDTDHGSSPITMPHAENQENMDCQGGDTKHTPEGSRRPPPTSCHGGDISSKRTIRAERGECPKVTNGGSSYHCIECGKYFTRKSSLIVHQRVHTGEKLYMCTECGRRFSFKSSLVRHMRTHPGQPLNICSQCGIDFSRYDDLSVHLEVHRSQLVLKMEPDDDHHWLPDNERSSDTEKTAGSVNEPEVKGQRSRDNQRLSPGAPEGDCPASSCDNGTHGDSLCIKEESPEISCIVGDPPEEHTDGDMTTSPDSRDWGDNFDLSRTLNRCEKVEEPRSPLETSTLQCADGSALGVSSWDHGSDEDPQAGGKRFLCAECGKSFTRKSSLIVHQRVHTGEKLFQCTQCGKSFGLKSSMVRHMRTHSSDPATCPECGKTFRDHSKLLQHQAGHQGD